MNSISLDIGKKIRNFRKCRGLTVQQLAVLINKSKATVCKYENGSIVIDIETLYDIGRTLNIRVEQLLSDQEEVSFNMGNKITNGFFEEFSRRYSYFYDGRNRKIVRCVIDLFSYNEDFQLTTALYMNIKDYHNYQDCEHTYFGFLQNYDVLSNIIVKNQATPIEQLTISVLGSFLNSVTMQGLMFGISSRPIMPIALKMLFSKTPLEESKELIDALYISKEDIRIMKAYNMFAVTN